MQGAYQQIRYTHAGSASQHRNRNSCRRHGRDEQPADAPRPRNTGTEPRAGDARAASYVRDAADSIPRSAGPWVAGSVQGPVDRGRPPSRPGLRLPPSPSRSRRSCSRRPGGQIAEQPPLALPTSDPTRLVPVRRTVAVSRTRDPKRSLAPIPRPFGKHRGNARRRSHCARRLFWRLGDWPSRLAEGERPPTRPSGVVTGNVRHGDRRNQVRAGATGGGRRVERSRQVFGERGKRAKRRRREGRHRPDAANHGGGAVSLDRDDIAEGSSRRRARRSLAADMAISGLTPSARPQRIPPGRPTPRPRGPPVSKNP